MFVFSTLLLLAVCTAAERHWAQHQALPAFPADPAAAAEPPQPQRRRVWIRPDFHRRLDAGISGDEAAAALQHEETPVKRFMSMRGESNTRTGKRGQLQQLFGARSVPFDAWDIDLAHLGPAPPAWRRNDRLGKVKFVSGMPIMRAIVRFVKHVTIPDNEVVAPGAELTKTWRVRNDSEEAWASECELKHVGGDSFSVVSPSQVRGALRPGAEMDISVGITAPSQPGTYQGFWRLAQKGGKKFGQRLWVSLVVAASSSSESDGEFVDVVPTTTVFQAELQTIKEMGFNDERVVVPLLNRHKGNVERVVTKLTAKSDIEHSEQQ